MPSDKQAGVRPLPPIGGKALYEPATPPSGGSSAMRPCRECGAEPGTLHDTKCPRFPGGTAAPIASAYRDGYLACAADQAAEQGMREAGGQAPIADMDPDELGEIGRLLDYLGHIEPAHRRAAMRLVVRCRELADQLGRAKRQAPEIIPDRDLAARTLAELATREQILQFFQFDHLPPFLRVYAQGFAELAIELVGTLPDNPQREGALCKLLEAKDCAVRAAIYKSGEAR